MAAGALQRHGLERRADAAVGGSENDDAFSAVKANSPADVWAVGQSGVVDVPGSDETLIEHFNGTAWSVVPSASPGSIDNLTGVTTANAANDVWAVGSDAPSGTSERQTLTSATIVNAAVACSASGGQPAGFQVTCGVRVARPPQRGG